MIIDIIEKHIKEVIDDGGVDFYLDEEYSIQSQMTDDIVNICFDEGVSVEREVINEILDDYEDELDEIKGLINEEN